MSVKNYTLTITSYEEQLKENPNSALVSFLYCLACAKAFRATEGYWIKFVYCEKEPYTINYYFATCSDTCMNVLILQDKL
jgi:hypothetical protein